MARVMASASVSFVLARLLKKYKPRAETPAVATATNAVEYLVFVSAMVPLLRVTRAVKGCLSGWPEALRGLVEV